MDGTHRVSSGGNDSDAGGESPGPSRDIVSQVVARIRSEPLLFVIGIVVLIAGLAAQAATLGSENFRFIVLVIALLATAAVVGYYIVQALQVRANAQTAAHPTSAGSSFVVNAPGAANVVSGDHAHIDMGDVVQGVGDTHAPLSVGEADKQPTDLRSVDTWPTGEAIAHGMLVAEIDRRERRVSQLRAKQRAYAGGDTPAELNQELDEEERAIERLQHELARRGTD